MAIFIAVVAHDHTRDIIDGLKPETINCQENITLVIKANRPCNELKQHCNEYSIDYLENDSEKGFGNNNNDIYLYCRVKHNMSDDDLFVVLNPDVIADPLIFHQINTLMREQNVNLAAPNLFKDEKKTILEGSIRKFPLPWDFIASFVLKSQRTTVKRNDLTEPTQVDWASGAFLAFRVGLYKKLSGFSPKYYLYCEDIDICWRAKILLNEPTWYIPNIKAIHKGHRHSHALFSQYIRWHIASAYRFSKQFIAWQWFGVKPRQPKRIQ